MTNARWFIAAVFLALTLTAVNFATAQVAVQADDLIGTWEVVSTKDLKTGAAVYGLSDASTGIQWMQFTRSHYMGVAMERGRSVMNPADFEKLSPEQIVTAGAGTYGVAGDKIHRTTTMAINTSVIGFDRVMKITRLDKSTMIVQEEYPVLNPTTTREVTFRRIE